MTVSTEFNKNAQTVVNLLINKQSQCSACAVCYIAVGL